MIVFSGCGDGRRNGSKQISCIPTQAFRFKRMRCRRGWTLTLQLPNRDLFAHKNATKLTVLASCEAHAFLQLELLYCLENAIQLLHSTVDHRQVWDAFTSRRRKRSGKHMSNANESIAYSYLKQILVKPWMIYAAVSNDWVPCRSKAGG